jgi:hypothetical protein
MGRVSFVWLLGVHDACMVVVGAVVTYRWRVCRGVREPAHPSPADPPHTFTRARYGTLHRTHCTTRFSHTRCTLPARSFTTPTGLFADGRGDMDVAGRRSERTAGIYTTRAPCLDDGGLPLRCTHTHAHTRTRCCGHTSPAALQSHAHARPATHTRTVLPHTPRTHMHHWLRVYWALARDVAFMSWLRDVLPSFWMFLRCLCKATSLVGVYISNSPSPIFFDALPPHGIYVLQRGKIVLFVTTVRAPCRCGTWRRRLICHALARHSVMSLSALGAWADGWMHVLCYGGGGEAGT